jgi:hypothetical protein
MRVVHDGREEVHRLDESTVAIQAEYTGIIGGGGADENSGIRLLGEPTQDLRQGRLAELGRSAGTRCHGGQSKDILPRHRESPPFVKARDPGSEIRNRVACGGGRWEIRGVPEWLRLSRRLPQVRCMARTIRDEAPRAKAFASHTSPPPIVISIVIVILIPIPQALSKVAFLQPLVCM